MNSALTAMGFWLAAFGAAPVGPVSSDHAPVLKGEIVLQRASYCDYGVVQTDRGFAFLDLGAFQPHYQRHRQPYLLHRRHHAFADHVAANDAA